MYLCAVQKFFNIILKAKKEKKSKKYPFQMRQIIIPKIEFLGQHILLELSFFVFRKRTSSTVLSDNTKKQIDGKKMKQNDANSPFKMNILGDEVNTHGNLVYKSWYLIFPFYIYKTGIFLDCPI